MKRRIAVLICMLILALGTMTVYAEDKSAMPRAVSCGGCRDGKLFDDYTTAEIMKAAGKCMHGKNGIDIAYDIQHQKRIKCGSCGRATAWEFVSWSVEVRCFGE